MEYEITARSGAVYSFATKLSIDEAAELLAKQPARTDFSASLLAAYRQNTLTVPMGHWLLKLASDVEAMNKEGPYRSLVQCLCDMQAKGKARVILRCVGITIKACSEGRNAGGCYLFSPDGQYVGKLTPMGGLDGPGHLHDQLEPIASDPVAAALAYGKETGSCACCGRELSDPVSIYGGIGPVCLERLAGKAARKAMEAQFKAEQLGQAQLLTQAPSLVMA